MPRACPTRKVVLDKLGNKCARCGWNDLPETLQVWRKDGETQTNPNESREKHFLGVLGELEVWELLCLNCKAVELKKRKTKDIPLVQEEPVVMVAPPPLLRALVWQTESPARTIVRKAVPLLDRLRGGAPVFVVCPEGVFDYPKWNQLGTGWEELTDVWGALPDETTGWVQQNQLEA